ncbi:LLM class flavin-dependent oxidoreductase [Amycolatopsis rhabdoformis]|uniref:LLM class flavin-dependent oxidoreductase n=1 Tax=Amycolatopsis rhabdoformis TaxID=1448059 RepID=A0ABZ1IIW0_9PSEU|nr:LLM class flavin-dependent oxidoreductase [Amycolatopsis rhabdoformis]WSE34332.1 LLM class flavin-dependent oxidoreductase [Amycolatopsis rhabdoformis]
MTSALATGRRTPKPRRIDDKMRFGLMWPNSPSPNVTSVEVAKRNPDVLDINSHITLAQTAERIGVDFVFFADGYTNHGLDNARVGHGEPCVSAPIWAPIVMAATEHLGVVTTMHARYLSPVVLARLGANLDVLSGGRWGWNIVPGAKGSEAKLFGLSDTIEHDERYQVVAETLEAVRALWGARGEPIKFDGKYYHLEGIPRGPYPVQESPVIFNAGVSPAGQEFIASSADYAFFAVVDDLAKVTATVRQLAEKTAAHGRDPREVNLAGSTGVVIARTSAEAAEKFAWIKDSLDMDAARGWARGFLAGSQTYQANFDQELDEAARKIGIAAGSRVLVGTAADIAEQLIEIHRVTGLRGFMLVNLLWAPEEVELLGDVFPILERAGVWETPESRGWSW